jgi:primary-amine oxidase
MRRLVLVLACLLPLPLAAQAPVHPLDGLSLAEHWTIYEVLRDAGHLQDGVRFMYAGLHEPPKAEVLGWSAGESFRREAMVHLVQGGAGYEGVVDLLGRSVVTFREVSGRQYMTSELDNEHAADVLEHPEVRAALERQGITDFDMVECGRQAIGYFDLPEERDRRIGRVTCGNRIGSLTGWGAPIANLVVVMDLETGEILRVVDYGPTPPPDLMGEHSAEAIGPTRPPLPPIVVSQPQGRGYVRSGHEVSWDTWRFHFRIDPRRGIVLSQVRQVDDGSERSVIYQASLSELFVPYQDPHEPWNNQAYYDLGTYPASFGGIAGTLEPGEDCPGHAEYFDTYVVTKDGSPTQRARVACLYERPGAEPAWRHGRGAVVESRSRTDLVLRMIMGAGNYDYLFDWVFKQDGGIRVNLAATGIDQVKNVVSADATEDGDDGEGADDRYGRFVAPHLVAVNHSHFFNFRIDFDVDGPTNSLAVDKLVTERQPEDNPRRSLWMVETIVAEREEDGMRTSTLSAPEFWRVVNHDVVGPQGYPSGYLLEGHGAKTLLSPDDYLQRRAAFTDHTIWTTPMVPSELYAAGDYPTASVAGQGLPEWTRNNRPIADTDIVLWYTIGFHHVARPEDWPVLPLELHGFDIKPAAFFSRSPAMTIPR